MRLARFFSNVVWSRLAVVVTGFVGGMGAQAQPTLIDLGTFGAGYAEASAVSDDGSVVVGYGSLWGEDHAFRWTASGGMIDLGTFPGSSFSSASCVSGNGAIVAGYATSDGGGDFRAFRWTAASGMQNLGVLPGGSSSYARGANGDGSVIVGFCIGSPGTRAFRWAGAMQPLQALTSGVGCVARGVTDDGATVVGLSKLADDHHERAVLWIGFDPPVSLGILSGMNNSSGAAISNNGTFVVGDSDTDGSSSRAFIWTGTEGMVSLGIRPEWEHTYALDVSDDGQTVVGRALTPAGIERAFIWTSAEGIMDLSTYLTTLGVALSGWQLQSARGVNGDGTVIVGTGVKGGATRAWAASGLPGPCMRIVSQPIDVDVCTTGGGAFAVTAFGRDGTYAWQWRPSDGEAWIDVVNGVNNDPVTGEPVFDASGSYTTELLASPHGDEWSLRASPAFRCEVSNPCGSVTSDAASLTVCGADLNCDSFVDFIDFLAFLNFYVAQDVHADINRDGLVDFSDYLEFLNLFDAGC